MEPNMQSLLKLSTVILGSLGGGAFIILGFSSWLGKVWANRLMAKEKAEHSQELESLRNRLTQDTESYKIKLKKSEFIFQKEYEAASEFVSLRRSFSPSLSYPGMDYYDACVQVADQFSRIGTTFDGFISKHGAVLKDPVKKAISKAINLAETYKFDVGPEQDLSRETMENP